jgi:hypothetical protein
VVALAGLAEMDATDLPEGAALVDSENVFKPFRKDAPTHFPRDAPFVRTAEALNRRDIPLEEVWSHGPAYFEALVAWLERRFHLVTRRSYGKHYDKGVLALYSSIMAASTWTHTDVPEGKDKADDAIVEDLDLLFYNPRYKALVVASSDAESVLAKLNTIAAGGWHRCVVILGPSWVHRRRFEPGGNLQHLTERYTLASIFAEEATLRTGVAAVVEAPRVGVAAVAREARKKNKRRTAAEIGAAYAAFAAEIHVCEEDEAGREIDRRFRKADNVAAVASIQARMTRAVRNLPDDERRSLLLDWIAGSADTLRQRLGEKPE